MARDYFDGRRNIIIGLAASFGETQTHFAVTCSKVKHRRSLGAGFFNDPTHHPEDPSPTILAAFAGL